MTSGDKRTVFLSSIYDSQYLSIRGEPIPPCLSSPKHVHLLKCIQKATSQKLLILSCPPKGYSQMRPLWLHPVATKFSEFEQLFCGSFDAPKIRALLSPILYFFHAVRHVKRGDLIIMHNYYVNYSLLALYFSIRYKSTIIIDYEDGRHLIDKGVGWYLCRFAEFLGKRLVHGAILANALLGKRLSINIPKTVIPGFYSPKAFRVNNTSSKSCVRFLYAGTLDETRGVDLLLDAIPLISIDGWALDISGAGPLEPRVREFISNPRYKGKVFFHSVLEPSRYSDLISNAHVGLNPQRVNDPVSSVTFPSKIFSYLSAELLIITSEACGVRDILGNICIYYQKDDPISLATAMVQVIRHLPISLNRDKRNQFSVESTSDRLRSFFQQVVPSFL